MDQWEAVPFTVIEGDSQVQMRICLSFCNGRCEQEKDGDMRREYLLLLVL